MASYSFGGTSSSSSLSPLAPPFMLEKPFSKIHPNPPTNFCDPSNGTRLEHQVSIWNPLGQDSSSGTNYMESGLGGIGYQPSSDIYKKPDPQQEISSSSDSAHLLALNSLARAVYDDYSYEPYPNSLSAPTVEADTYHPSYSLPTPTTEQDIMPHTERNYDLLTSFGSGSQAGYTSLDDTRRNLSGVHYTPHWNGLWSGLTNTEQGKWLDIGGTFGSTVHKPPSSDLSFTRSYANQDQGKWLNLAGNFGSKDHNQSSDTSTSKSYVIQGQHVFGSSGHLVETSVSNNRPQDSSIAKAPTTASADVLNGKLDLQNPIQEYFCKKESACGDLSGSRESYASYAAPAMRSSPPAVTEVSLSEFTSTKRPFASIKGSGRSNGVVEKPHNYPEYAHFGQKDSSYFTLGLSCPVTDKAFTAHSQLPGSSSTIPENGLTKRSDFDSEFTEFLKSQSSSDHLWGNPNYMKSKDEYSKIFYSVEKPADIHDGQNTSEDSPCWKGASSAHFSPFSDMRITSPELEKGPLSTTVAVQPAAGNVNQTAKEKVSQSNCISAENDGTCAASPMLFSFGLAGKDGSRFSSKHNSKTSHGSKSSQVPEMTSEVKEDASKKKAMSFSTVHGLKDAKCGCVSSPGPLSVSSSVDLNLASSPSRIEASSKRGQLPGKEMDVKLNIGMIVNAMKSMSELLSLHCSSNPAVAQELDREALKQTISNLDSCLVKEIDLVEQDDKIDHAQISKVPAADMDSHGHDALKISRCDIFQSKTKDDEVVQAIRRVLVEKFSCDKEMQEKPILYKNLWLEAEAELCAVTTKARLDRMKMGMEMVKCNSQGTDVPESALNSSFPTEVKKSGNQSQTEKSEPSKTNNDAENAECSSSFAELDSVRKIMSFDAERSYVMESDQHGLPPAADNTTCPPRDMMESSVLSRFSILKSLCDVNNSKPGGPTPPAVERQSQHGPFVETQIRDMLTSSGEAESPVMSRFQILKSRSDYLDSLKTDDGTPASPTYEDVVCPPTLDHSIQDSYFSSASSYEIENGDDPEVGVMARFNLLKKRNDAADLRQQMAEFDGTNSRGVLVESGCKLTEKQIASEDQSVGGVSRSPLAEGWYECSGSDWEHIVKEDFARQK